MCKDRRAWEGSGLKEITVETWYSKRDQTGGVTNKITYKDFSSNTL